MTVLNRTSAERNNLSKNILYTIIDNGFVVTNHQRLKYVQRKLEKLITKCKNKTLSNVKLVSSHLGNDRLRTGKIFQIVSNLSERNGGYTAVKKLRFRKGDNSLESVLFFKDDKRFKNE